MPDVRIVNHFGQRNTERTRRELPQGRPFGPTSRRTFHFDSPFYVDSDPSEGASDHHGRDAIFVEYTVDTLRFGSVVRYYCSGPLGSTLRRPSDNVHEFL